MCDISSDPSMHDPPVSTKTRVTCERRIGWITRTDGWGSIPVLCRQRVGVTSWVSDGVTRHACAKHVGVMKRRYPA